MPSRTNAATSVAARMMRTTQAKKSRKDMGVAPVLSANSHHRTGDQARPDHSPSPFALRPLPDGVLRLELDRDLVDRAREPERRLVGEVDGRADVHADVESLAERDLVR